MNPMAGRGCGFGMGRGRGGWGGGGGRGWRNMFHATGLTGWQRAAAGWGGVVPPAAVAGPDQEVDVLRRQAAALEGQLKAVQARLDELATAEKEKE
jgi:hypothetical protein